MSSPYEDGRRRLVRLGIDTGGTYTDAVLLDSSDQLLAWSKALTTRENLADGIGAAVDALFANDVATVAEIAMVSLSTTLATNALVERQGDRIALIFAGFSERDRFRQDLDKALQGDPLIELAGGHDHAGNEAAELDTGLLSRELDAIGDKVSAFAVAARFATRNPAHEIRIRDMIREVTGKPVTCSHELSARLGGPKRATTAVLNSRLIGLIDHLIDATELLLIKFGISVPLMVVRGDGALMSAVQARTRPIETILSGPAASVVCASRFTGESNAIVSDMGGTTTDVAILRAGRPAVSRDGAVVGGYHTMVEAVAVRTTGLGGDSEVGLIEGRSPTITLGPRRVVPVSLAALDDPDSILDALDRQLQQETPGEFDGQFVLPASGRNRMTDGLGDRETRLLDRLDAGLRQLGSVVRSRLELSTLDRLVSRGLAFKVGVTPSDAAHVLGLLKSWDGVAADKALSLMSRKLTASGNRLANSATELSTSIVNQLTRQSSNYLLECAFAWEQPDFGSSPEKLAVHEITQAGLSHHRNLVALDVGLNLPIIALGAPATTYYGAVGERLSTQIKSPPYAEVANAVGAVVGQVVMSKRGQVTSPAQGCFRVHSGKGMSEVSTERDALELLEMDLAALAEAAAELAGCVDIGLNVETEAQHSEVGGNKELLQVDMCVTATGRPRFQIQATGDVLLQPK